MAAAGIGAGALQILPLAAWELAAQGLPQLSGLGWLGVALSQLRVFRIDHLPVE